MALNVGAAGVATADTAVRTNAHRVKTAIRRLDLIVNSDNPLKNDFYYHAPLAHHAT